MRVESAGLELAWSERGSGPPVLLVHGFGGSGRAWGETVLDALAGRHRVLVVDLPGHGASGDPADERRVALGPVLDDLARILQAAGVAACPWIGYSMGGRIALAAALLCPRRVTALVLESASPGLMTEAERSRRRADDDALARSILADGVDDWVEAWEASPLFAGRQRLDPDARAALLADRRANRTGSLAAWLRGLGLGSQPSFWDRLGAVGVPTLLVTGADDERYGEIARRMADVIPQARQARISGAGHTVHLERPQAWLDAVRPFLADIDFT